MRRNLATLLLWGWFFTFESQLNTITMFSKVSGFKTQQECEGARAQAKAEYENIRIPVRIGACRYEQTT